MTRCTIHTGCYLNRTRTIVNLAMGNFDLPLSIAYLAQYFDLVRYHLVMQGVGQIDEIDKSS